MKTRKKSLLYIDMEFNFHSVNLLCSDLQSQCSFLSFVFDVEIMFDKEERFFLLGGVKFNLIESSGHVSNMIAPFELVTGCAQDLKDLKQKLELYAYKTGRQEVKSSFNSMSLEFEDPSGNLWKVNQNSETPSRAVSGSVLM